MNLLILVAEATVIFSLTSTGATDHVVIMERAEHQELLPHSAALEAVIPELVFTAPSHHRPRSPRGTTIERAARRLLERYQPLELTTVPPVATVRRRRGSRRPPRRSWLRRQRP